MRKGRKIGNAMDMIGQILFIVLVLLLIFLVIGLFTGHTWNIGQKLKGTLDGSLSFDSDYVPPVQATCKSYDITNEFKKAYGESAILTLANGCNNVGGTYFQEYARMGCYWNPAVHTFDCNSKAVASLEYFCEDMLKATWTCDNTIAFVGCTCQGGLPATWQETCWWSQIDGYDGSLKPMTRTEWKNTLVPGKYKWEWVFASESDVELIRATSTMQTYSNSIAGGYTFNAPSSEPYGIAVSNYMPNPVDATIKLFQWVCEGDNLNWNPKIFDKPYSEEQAQIPGSHLSN